MSTKVCTGCAEEKSLEDYFKHKKGRFGRREKCKNCTYQQTKDWRAKNPDKVKEIKNVWAESNREKTRTHRKTWYNKFGKDYNSKWFRLNLERCRAQASFRRARLLNATPSWITDDQKAEIDQFYWMCRDLQAVTGETYHVDHVIPLQGKTVCGLHVPWNLQVLPADVNLTKSNKF